MATLIVSIGGAVLGNALGLGISALGLSGAAVGWTIGSMIGNAVFNRPKDQYGPRIQDLRVTGTEYGQVIPWFIGSFRTSGQIIWASRKREIATTTKVGKGAKQKVTTYTYEVDVMYLIGQRGDVSVPSYLRRIWSNGQLIYRNDGINPPYKKKGTFGSVSVKDPTSEEPDPVYAAAVGVDNAPAYRGFTTVRISDLQLGEGGYMPNLSFEFHRDVPYNVGDAIDLVYRRSGLYQTPQYDFTFPPTEAAPPIKGLIVSNITPTRQIIESLTTAFGLTVSKSDAIYIKTRASEPIVTIPYEDLATTDSGNKDPFSLSVSNNLEKVSKIVINYVNILNNHNTGTESAERNINYLGKFGGNTDGLTQPVSAENYTTETVQLPLVMNPEDAKAIANTMMADNIGSLFTVEIAVPLKYAYLEPGDLITVVDKNNKQYQLRITTRKDQMPYLIFSCVLDITGNFFIRNSTDNSETTDFNVPIIVDTNFHALDIPLLRDEDDKVGYYVGISSQRTIEEDNFGQKYEWPGAVFAESKNLLTYENIFITGNSGVIGVVQNVLGDFDRSNVFDHSNYIDVEVQGGQLNGVTRDLMLSDLSVNSAVVGNEIIRFKNMSLIDSTSNSYTYRLTGLLRGQRGTEQYMTGHSADERFVLLDFNIRTVEDSISSMNNNLKVKAVTLDESFAEVEGVDFINTGVRLKPFSVANLRAVSENGTDIKVSWQRRTRYQYAYGGSIGTYVPLGEVEERYRVKIYDGATLVRTEEVTTPEYIYTNSNAISDGFSSTDTATIVVTQLSELIGEGFESQTDAIIL